MSTPTMSTGDLRQNDALLIVSTLLQDFYENNSTQAIVSTGKILTTLLKNAVRETDDPKKQEMYGKVRLTNPKIKQNVVEVNGAMDILGLAGFVHAGEFLNFSPKTRNALELYLEDEAPSQEQALIESICQGLELKIKELEPTLVQKKSIVSSSPSSATSTRSNDNENNSPFLSDEERLQRIEKIKAMKKAKKQQRQAAVERFKENAEERKAAAERREAVLKQRTDEEAKQGLAMNVNIKSASNTNNTSSSPSILPKPFEDPKEQMAAAARARAERAKKQMNVAAAAEGDDPQAIRRQLIQDAMKNPNLTAAQKQVKVQELMKAGPEALKAAVLGDETPMDLDDPAVAAANDKMEDDDEEDKKPAAKDPHPSSEDVVAVRGPAPPSSEWKAFLENVPRCASAEGIRETSVFNKSNPDADMSVPQCLKRLFKELDGLKDALPSDPNCSIWLRFDEETPQYIRALMTAPLPGPTPYSGGLFAFDIYVPNEYPQVNPQVQIITTGGGKVRFGPNLYACGKVCLSLLGTWNGPKWNPKHSSLHQVLISIQGLLLGVEHPYYLEPGHGGWEGQVKEGQYQREGQTLSGKIVSEEVGVPNEVIMYEDVLRVGTAKYAMHQPLQWSLLGSTNKNGLEAFYDIIQAHFYINRDAVVTEVRNWMNDSALGRKRDAMKSANSKKTSLPIDELQQVLPKLEKLLAKNYLPKTSSAKAAVGDAMDTDEEAKPAARSPSPGVKRDNTPSDEPAKRNKTEQPPNTAGADVLEHKRQHMQEAANEGDYVLAGKIQEEINRLEELQRAIQEAAAKHDFIRAGRLQAQFKALTATVATTSSSTAAGGNQQSTSAWNEEEEFDDDEEDDDDDDEEEMAPPFAGPAGMQATMGNAMGSAMGQPPPHGLGKNVFAPPAYRNNMPNRMHSWGTGGYQLGAAAAGSTSTVEEQTDTKKAAPKQSIPPQQLCRLRIRLPQNKSVVEDFDKNDSLSAVYRRLEPLVERDGREKKGSVTGPAAVGAGAFAQPLSSAGFTLLLTRPKREFSLEMHGTTSLLDLNLAPSATLTVMFCNERGIMYRGEVESRLQGAQGDAMDVEGLSYESLMELTERVGAAGPQKDSSFLNLTQEEFEANTEKFSPSTYLQELMDEGNNDERRCPICLGNYDSRDCSPSLRKVKRCGHTMHTGCLETWLRTNSSCPLCKTPVRSEE